jgi:hypothetical protein
MNDTQRRALWSDWKGAFKNNKGAPANSKPQNPQKWFNFDWCATVNEGDFDWVVQKEIGGYNTWVLVENGLEVHAKRVQDKSARATGTHYVMDTGKKWVANVWARFTGEAVQQNLHVRIHRQSATQIEQMEIQNQLAEEVEELGEGWEVVKN